MSTDFGQSGALALSCFVVIAVCPLNRRWLIMEQTAQSAGLRLSELNSREGDWFLDELCTMSGNVSQMIDLLESCFEVSFMPSCTAMAHWLANEKLLEYNSIQKCLGIQ